MQNSVTIMRSVSRAQRIPLIQGDIKLECNYSRIEQLHSVYLYFADGEAIADGLNPLTISQIPRNISFKIIGRAKIIPALILMPNISNKFHVNNNATAMRPQTDSHRGTSFD
jgi:hypothetical protein